MKNIKIYIYIYIYTIGYEEHKEKTIAKELWYMIICWWRRSTPNDFTSGYNKLTVEALLKGLHLRQILRRCYC